MSHKTGLILGNGEATVNQILPHKHLWVWELYMTSCANNWMPTEISMQNDALQWENGTITEDEKLLVKRCIGFFAGTESLVANNLMSAMRFISDPECLHYMNRQAFEESLHNLTIVTVCDSLRLSTEEVYEAYRNIPSIKAKDDFLMSITTDVSRVGFDPLSIEGKTEILKDLLAFYIICEGTFFFSGFAMLLALGAQNKMVGLADQIRYTLRDETNHIGFGVYLINNIIQQNPELWTQDLQDLFTKFIVTAVELEIAYAKDALPNGILGLNSDMFIEYMHYIGNRRLEQIGLAYRFKSDHNPFPWLGEQVDIPVVGSFFERRERNYRAAGALEDGDV